MELNLNTVKRPSLKLTMMDENKTVLRVKVPTVDLFNKVRGMFDAIDGVEEGNRDSEEALYEVLAEFLSNNRDYIKVTVEEIRPGGKYGLDLEDAILVFKAYTRFVTDILNAKN